MTTRLAAMLSLLTAVGIATVPTADAAQLGAYVGGAYGVTDKDLHIEQFDPISFDILSAVQFTPHSHSATLETEDQGYSAMLGYRITAHLAVEGVFYEQGEASYRAINPGSFNTGASTVTNTLKGQSSGIGVHVLGIWPVSYRWELYARAGIQYTSSSLRLRLRDDEGRQLVLEERENAADYLAGVGVAMTLMDIYGARLEFVRIFDSAIGTTMRGDADMISLGFIVAF